MNEKTKEKQKIVEMWVQNEPTGGLTYETSCNICQKRPAKDAPRTLEDAVLAMIDIAVRGDLHDEALIPTHRTACLNPDEVWVFNYGCKECLMHIPEEIPNPEGELFPVKVEWVDKLPIFPNDVAITEIPAELPRQISDEMCKIRGINPDEYEKKKDGWKEK